MLDAGRFCKNKIAKAGKSIDYSQVLGRLAQTGLSWVKQAPPPPPLWPLFPNMGLPFTLDMNLNTALHPADSSEGQE